ncbi:MAG: hypothetical protein AB9922_02690 [Bacteroidales bacterium]
MTKRILLAFTVILIFLASATAQNTLTLTLASFKKWSKVISNTGYPQTETSNDKNIEFRAKFLLTMEKAFIVKITPLSTFEPLVQTLHNFEKYEWNGLNTVYGNIDKATYLIIEMPARKFVFTIKVDEKMNRTDLEELAENIKYKQL